MAKRWRSLLDTSKALIFSQLKQIIEELRSIPSETTGVSNLDGGPIHDYRLPKTLSQGPFGTVYDFHLALRNNVTFKSLKAQTHNSPSPAAVLDIQKLVIFHKSITRPLVLTHGDLSSFNILLRDNKVVGIIDQETTRWLLYYQEYTTAQHANPQNLFQQKEVDNFLDLHKAELGIDKLRRTYFREF